MALAHHDAAHRDQRGRREAKFFRAQQGGNNDVASGLQFAVGLHADTAAQIVQQQRLLGFGQSQFPRNSGVLDGTQGRCSGATAVATDQDNIGMGFRHARCNCPDSDFCYQLHCNAGLRIHILQIEDQLRQIFDRIDIVMGRR